ncbi:MAG: 4-(cytidine 5'-diphospho)-2-C-methyl-D-erythritol kinase, partial [Candidatus Omnitrophota bacterium]
MVLHSYAKLNLYLELLRKRHDGYHDIRTIFERIDLSDKIILKARSDKKIKLTCSSTRVPAGRSNLAYRSAKLLQDTFHIHQGVGIKIIKRIPVAAGLGGGSSNAASVLMGLNNLWGLHLDKNKLVRLAKRIGSDVPFFIYNCQFAQGSGRGDRIKPLKTFSGLRLWHILVVPRLEVSTPMIYKKWDGLSRTFKLTRQGEGVKIMTLALRKNNLPLLGEALFNSLEQVTAKLYPEILRIKEKLSQIGLKSILMSGSGPAIFSVVSSGKEALSLYRQLKRNKG